jgi:hypothetical protein
MRVFRLHYRTARVQPFMGIATFNYKIDLKMGGNAGLKDGETGVVVEAIIYYLQTTVLWIEAVLQFQLGKH